MAKVLRSKKTDATRSHCPSCGAALGKTPKRKTRCAHCSATIVVRKGTLIAESVPIPAKRSASRTSTRKRAGKRKDPAVSPKDVPKTGPAKVAELGTLDADLEFYANEVYAKGDWEAGWKLIKEAYGAAIFGSGMLAALTIVLPPVGIAVGSGMFIYIMSKVAEFYIELNAEERREVRSFVKELRRGVGF